MKNFSVSQKVYDSVKNQLIKFFDFSVCKKILVGVSGGADSMVLLHVLNRLQAELNFKLYGITINHNIREKEESLSDVLLVKNFAAFLSVPLFVHEYEPHYIENVERERKKGIEEAARYCRYKAFYEYISKNQIDCVCLAHNFNDQLETLLQRVFQGASLNEGIPKKRELFFRPLLEITRLDIEAYAKENNIKFCIDSTNLENKYLRNKIRNQLIPLLDSIMPNWKSGIMFGNRKIQLVNELLSNQLEKIEWSQVNKGEDKELIFNFNEFNKLEKILKINLIYKGLENFEEGNFYRFPYQLIENFVDDYKSINSGKIEIFSENQNIHIKKIKKIYDKERFYTIIDKEGFYAFPFGTVEIFNKYKTVYSAKVVDTSYVSGDFTLPVLIRSRDDSDEIEDKNMNKKNIGKIFSEWNVDDAYREQIPIFIDSKVRGIWGEPFGYENFFVLLDEDL